MSYDYARIQSTAKRLISRFGGEVSITVPASGDFDSGNFDPATGEYTTATPEVKTYEGVLVKYDKQEGLISDTLSVRSANKIIIAGSCIAQVGDLVSINGAEFVVAYRNEIKPNGVDVITTTLLITT